MPQGRKPAHDYLGLGTTFGGLARRYKDNGFGLVHCADPIRRRKVLFPDQLHKDNWLTYFPDRALHTLETEYEVEVVIGKRTRRCRLDLYMQREGARPRGQEVKASHVLRKVPLPKHVVRQRETQMAAAEAHGFDFELRTEECIRANPYLLINAERVRTVLVRWLSFDLTNLAQQVCDSLFVGAVLPLKAIVGRISQKACAEPESVEAAVYRLYFLKQIDLALNERAHPIDGIVCSAR